MRGKTNELDMLETALEAADIAWWTMELPSGTIFFSPVKTRMIGREKDNFYHYKHFTDLVHKDDYKPMMKAMYDLIEGRTDTYETTYRIKAADGNYRRFYDKGKIVGKKNGETTIAGVVFNLSKSPYLKMVDTQQD